MSRHQHDRTSKHTHHSNSHHEPSPETDHDHSHHEPHHGHHHHAPKDYGSAFAIGLVLNLGFVVIEVVAGLMSDSVALLADAGHNLSDVLGLVLAWSAVLLARRQPSRRYTYGWRRSSILAAFLNALFLMMVTGGIAWEAIQRFWHPGKVQGQTMILVAAIGIVVNATTALLFMSGRKSDMNIRAAFLHMAADAFVSFGVVLAGIGILLTQWQWLDPAFSLVISAVIIFNTWELLRDSFNLVMDAVPTNIDERAVRTYLSECPDVAQVHDLHIWAMSTTETALTAHLVIPSGFPGDAYITHIVGELQAHFGIAHATLQIETGDVEYPCRLNGECCQ